EILPRLFLVKRRQSKHDVGRRFRMSIRSAVASNEVLQTPNGFVPRLLYLLLLDVDLRLQARYHAPPSLLVVVLDDECQRLVVVRRCALEDAGFFCKRAKGLELGRRRRLKWSFWSRRGSGVAQYQRHDYERR